MFQTLAAKTPQDKDLPERAWRIAVLRLVLQGKFYDCLKTPFHKEVNDAGEHISILDRRPSVRTRWCRTVVDDSVSLVFDDGHFPEIDCEDEPTRDTLRDLVKETKLNAVMIDAAVRGSVGSVAICMRVLKSRVFFQPMDTEFLTPTWDPEAPDTLIKVREQYKVKGKDLVALGYHLDKPDAVHWFAREWDGSAETWFLPWPVASDDPDKPVVPQIDTKRSKEHKLGFVPIAWIRNLPGGDEIDGEASFHEDAICTMIEADYQMSQAGRGLRYSSDPKLVIKGDMDGVKVSATKALVLPGEVGADAKLLEINGTAAARVMDYVRGLREIAMESMHGNRADPQKMASAQSGRAMELMNQALIWLAGRLRTSYGEGGLLSLLKMVVAAGTKLPIEIMGKTIPAGTLKADDPVSLKWPHWYAPTAEDRKANASAIKTARDSGVMSVETGVAALAHDYDIEDQPAEIALIAKEKAEAIEQLPPDKTQVTETADL
jgi:hypothetical protein